MSAWNNAAIAWLCSALFASAYVLLAITNGHAWLAILPAVGVLSSLVGAALAKSRSRKEADQ